MVSLEEKGNLHATGKVIDADPKEEQWSIWDLWVL
jgi:hypothetical protein